MKYYFLEAASSAAQTPAENPWSSAVMIGIMVLMFVVMYFLIIRPSKKKQKEEEAMRNSVEIGDDVTTIGGIVGRVISIREDDDTLIVETGSDKTRIRFKKWAISSIDTPDKQKKTEKKEKKEKSSDKKTEGSEE